MRSQNKICLDWPKPAPTFEYTVIVFSIIHYDGGLCGVAKTIDDMIDAIFKSEIGVGDETAEISFFYLNFDPGRDGKRSLPIAIFPTEVYNDGDFVVAREHPWKKLLGIDCPLKGESALYIANDLFVSEGWIKNHGNPEYIIGSNLGVLKHWSRNLHKPKVDIDLSRFEGVHNNLNINDDDSYCNDPFPPDTEVWYNFEDSPNTSDTMAPNKSWILFDAYQSISVQGLY